MEADIRPEVRRLKKAIHGGDVWEFFSDASLREGGALDFSSNVNPLGPPKKALDAVKGSLDKLEFYPDPDSRELKRAVSEYLEVGVDHVTVGNGSTELIKNFLELVAKKGYNVVIPEPTFSEYGVCSRLYGARVKHVYAEGDENFAFVPEKIIEEIDGETKVVFICNPNNPTGKTLKEKELEEIIESAYENDSFLFVDEAFIEFSSAKTLCHRIDEFDNLFVLRSITKFFSLPGLRVGYGIGGERLIDYLERIRIPWNVNLLGQIAAIESMRDRRYIEKTKTLIKRERDFLFEQLTNIDHLKTYDSDANFFLIDIRGTQIKAPEMKRRMIEKGVLIRDCGSFEGLDRYFIRVSVRKRDENLVLLEGLREAIGNA